MMTTEPKNIEELEGDLLSSCQMLRGLSQEVIELNHRDTLGEKSASSIWRHCDIATRQGGYQALEWDGRRGSLLPNRQAET